MEKIDYTPEFISGMNEITDAIGKTVGEIIRLLNYGRVKEYLEEKRVDGEILTIYELIGMYFEIIVAKGLSEFKFNSEFIDSLKSDPKFKNLSIEEAVRSLLRQAFLDIYGLQILGIVKGIPEGVLKKILYKNMIEGNVDSRMTLFGIIMTKKSNTDLDDLIDNNGDGDIKHPACPFIVSEGKTQWIDKVWGLVKEEIIPQIRSYYKSSEDEIEQFWSGAVK